MNNPSKQVALLYLAIVFLAGSILGAAAHRYYAVQIADAEVESQASDKPRKSKAQKYRERLMSKLQQDLALRPEQVQQVDEILDDIGIKFRAAHDTLKPQIEAIRAKRAERIMAILDPLQQEKYEQILDERRRHREKDKCP